MGTKPLDKLITFGIENRFNQQQLITRKILSMPLRNRQHLRSAVSEFIRDFKSLVSGVFLGI